MPANATHFPCSAGKTIKQEEIAPPAVKGAGDVVAS
jgi:hypothetical protein